jgi:RNA recognition motif-containing protein
MLMSERKKLFIGNLNYGVTSSELSDLISQNWVVVECKLIEGKGIAFVTFENDEKASEAKEALNGYELKGRNLKVDFALDNNDRKPRKSFAGGSGGGSRGPKRY